MFDVEVENSAAVEAQAESTRSGSSIWNALLRADGKALEAIIAEHGVGILQERGPVGECPIHLAFLYNSPDHAEIIDIILAHDPLSVFAQYVGDEYHGENCLHIAIINQNLQLVQRLLGLPNSHQLLLHV